MKISFNIAKIVILFFIVSQLVILTIWSCKEILHDNKGPGALLPFVTIGLGYSVSYLLLLPAYVAALWSKSWVLSIMAIIPLLLPIFAASCVIYYEKTELGSLISIFLGIAPGDLPYKITLLNTALITLVISLAATIGRKLIIRHTNVVGI